MEDGNHRTKSQGDFRPDSNPVVWTSQQSSGESGDGRRMARLRAAGYDAPFTSLEDGVAEYVTRHLAAEDPYL